ncbi:MAG TPA: hypothetical protein VL283_00310, partial [Candidatus Baltobacteraceae bacterium]|nr:hypothetical protein [Candidatus Baltobacteraceae bacterium]
AMFVLGSTDAAPLIVVPPEGRDDDRDARIALAPGGEVAVTWSRDIALADVLLCLDADAVVKTSQLRKTGEDGSN